MTIIGKLGRIPHDPVVHAKLPAMVRYSAQAVLPPPPQSQDWYTKISYWPMLKNDLFGDCTCAGVLHAVQQWRTYASGRLWIPADDTALRLYSLFGFDPSRPAETDQGVAEIDILTTWLKGFDLGDGLDRLAAFATIQVPQADELRYAIAWFGSAYLGIDLPKSIEGPLEGIEWDISPAGTQQGAGVKGSMGPHCIIAVGYDPDWIYVVTWGRLVRMSWAFWLAYGDEAYALLSADFSNTPGITPADIPWNDLVHEWDTLRPTSLVS